MSKETSAHIAALAARVLAMEPREYHGGALTLTDAKSLAGSALSQREFIEAQANGDDIFELVGAHEISAETVIGDFAVYTAADGSITIRPRERKIAEGEFLIGGYSIKLSPGGTNILVTDYTGKTAEIKANAFTGFLQRRLDDTGEPT